MTEEAQLEERIEIDTSFGTSVIFRTWDGDRIVDECVEIRHPYPELGTFEVVEMNEIGGSSWNGYLPGDRFAHSTWSPAPIFTRKEKTADLKKWLQDAHRLVAEDVELLAHPDFDLRMIDPAARTPGRVTQADFDLVRNFVPGAADLSEHRLDKYIDILLRYAHGLVSLADLLRSSIADDRHDKALKQFFANAPTDTLLVDSKAGLFARLSDTRGTQTKRSLEILNSVPPGESVNILADQRKAFHPLAREEFACIPAGAVSAHTRLRAIRPTEVAAAQYPEWEEIPRADVWP